MCIQTIDGIMLQQLLTVDGNNFTGCVGTLMPIEDGLVLSDMAVLSTTIPTKSASVIANRTVLMAWFGHPEKQKINCLLETTFGFDRKIES